MLEQKELEEIKKLIQSGFDEELISFELDVPIDQVKQCKINIERDSITTKTEVHKQEKRTRQDSKLGQIRERYKELYFGESNVDGEEITTLSSEQLEFVKTVISTIEEKIQTMSTLSRDEKIKKAREIVYELNKLEGYKLSIEQTQRLYELMSCKGIKELNFTLGKRKDPVLNVANGIDRLINTKRSIIIKMFAQAVENKLNKINDVQELKKLQEGIPEEMLKEGSLILNSVKSKISSRIVALYQQQAINRMKNDIPLSISSVITDLVNGNLDIERANAIIDEEAQKRLDSKPKTKFSLTKEQERKQIFMQIRRILRERADMYHIKDPKTTIGQIQQLCGEELDLSISAVIENLINSKAFEKAKSVCDSLAEENRSGFIMSQTEKTILSLREKIRCAEIGDMFMKVIKHRGTIEEEMKCFSLMEKGLETAKIQLHDISLGKSKDGLRNITLQDVWFDKSQKSR